MHTDPMSVVTVDFGNALKSGGVSLRLPEMSHAEFYEFCQRNPALNVELSADGAIILMSPVDFHTDTINSRIVSKLIIWNDALPEPGEVSGPSAGFTMPDGSIRSPDAAWTSAERLNALSEEDRRGFAKVCPDFVLELMSPSDRPGGAKEKMEEYIANGARLGWLIHRKRRKVYVFRPGKPMDTLNDPATVSGVPELPGFTLSMDRIFERP
jgi:Uma2 family endonuclease